VAGQETTRFTGAVRKTGKDVEQLEGEEKKELTIKIRKLA